MSYGTGAIMAVPRPRYPGLRFRPRPLTCPLWKWSAAATSPKEAFTDCATGVMVNSGFLTGMTVEEAKKAIIQWLEEHHKGTPKVNFKLRDWVFSQPPALLGRTHSPPLSTATSAVMCRWKKAQLPLDPCRKWKATSPPTTVSLLWPI